MPTYDFRCTNNHRFERVLKLAEYDTPQECPCGASANRLISPPRVIVTENVHYRCPITEEVISSKHAHEENLRRHDCHVLEAGEKELNERRRVEETEKVYSKIEEDVERVLDQMPSDKKEVLAKELSVGADVSVERI
jgi:putative FmdB family regulatory protein